MLVQLLLGRVCDTATTTDCDPAANLLSTQTSPSCNVGLKKATSAKPCRFGVSFGCNGAGNESAIWVQNGCRGVFTCAGRTVSCDFRHSSNIRVVDLHEGTSHSDTRYECQCNPSPTAQCKSVISGQASRDHGGMNKEDNHTSATNPSNMQLAPLNVLVLIVGVWRGHSCGHSAIKRNLLSANPSARFSFVVGTTTSYCAPKDSFCNQTRNEVNLAQSILEMYPSAKVFIDQPLEAGQRSRDSLDLLYGHPLFLQRLKVTYEQGIKSERLGFGGKAFDVVVALRPDVVLDQPVHLPSPMQRGLMIMLSKCARAPCIFADRDFDFGFIASPPQALELWLNPPNLTSAGNPQPCLPEGFNGLWEPSKNPPLKHNGLCWPYARPTRAQTAGFENKMLELAAFGAPLLALHKTAWCDGCFLMLVRERRGSGKDGNLGMADCVPEVFGCRNKDDLHLGSRA